MIMDPVALDALDRLLRALAVDCENTDGWVAAAPDVIQAADTIASLRQIVGVMEAGFKQISHLRPAGDVATAPNTRALVQQMEAIALNALHQLEGLK